MSATNVARKAIHDRIEAQIKIAQAKLESLKAKAESTKAKTELAAIVELLTKKQAIAQKVGELKATGETTYEQAKSDVEARIADLEKSVQAIEAKFKAA